MMVVKQVVPGGHTQMLRSLLCPNIEQIPGRLRRVLARGGVPAPMRRAPSQAAFFFGIIVIFSYLDLVRFS